MMMPLLPAPGVTITGGGLGHCEPMGQATAGAAASIP